MKVNQIVESTTSGAVASVAMPLGGVQKRAGSLFKGKKTKKKFYESKMKDLMYDIKNLDSGNFVKKYGQPKEYFQKRLGNVPVREAEITEQDLIVVPGMRRMKDTSFIPHKADRRDHEVEMARSDLYAAAKNAMRIFQLLKNRTEDEGLMGWQQSYITLASDYLNSVADSLEYNVNVKGNVDEMTGGVLAGGMSNFEEGLGEGSLTNIKMPDELFSSLKAFRKTKEGQPTNFEPSWFTETPTNYYVVLPVYSRGAYPDDKRYVIYSKGKENKVQNYGMKYPGSDLPTEQPWRRLSQRTGINQTTGFWDSVVSAIKHIENITGKQGVAEGYLEEISRREFLKHAGALSIPTGVAAVGIGSMYKLAQLQGEKEKQFLDSISNQADVEEYLKLKKELDGAIRGIPGGSNLASQADALNRDKQLRMKRHELAKKHGITVGPDGFLKEEVEQGIAEGSETNIRSWKQLLDLYKTNYQAALDELNYYGNLYPNDPMIVGALQATKGMRGKEQVQAIFKYIEQNYIKKGVAEGSADMEWHGSNTDMKWYDAYKDQPVRVKVKNHSGLGGNPSGTFKIRSFKKIGPSKAELTITFRGEEMTGTVDLDNPETVVNKMYDRVPAMNFYIGSMPATARQAFNLFQYKNKKQGVAEGSISEITDFKRKELEYELRNEPKNNYGVAIDGKAWKVFSDERQARNIANSLIRKGKKATVYSTLAPVSENKVKNIDEGKCPKCGGPSYAIESIAEEKDACYHKVKSRYKVWPSAYASGALVKCRKVGASNWGNKSKK